MAVLCSSIPSFWQSCTNPLASGKQDPTLFAIPARGMPQDTHVRCRSSQASTSTTSSEVRMVPVPGALLFGAAACRALLAGSRAAVVRRFPARRPAAVRATRLRRTLPAGVVSRAGRLPGTALLRKLSGLPVILGQLVSRKAVSAYPSSRALDGLHWNNSAACAASCASAARWARLVAGSAHRVAGRQAAPGCRVLPKVSGLAASFSGSSSTRMRRVVSAAASWSCRSGPASGRNSRAFSWRWAMRATARQTVLPGFCSQCQRNERRLISSHSVLISNAACKCFVCIMASFRFLCRKGGGGTRLPPPSLHSFTA